MNILLFLCKEYNLDIRFVGSIMSFYQYTPPNAPPVVVPPKEIQTSFNTYNDNLSLDLKNDTLYKVVKKIVQVSKKNVVLAHGIENRIVSVYIENTPFESALDKMAYSNKLKVVKTPDNFYLLEPADENTPNTANGPVGKNKKNSTPSPFSSSNPTPANSGSGNGNFEYEVNSDSLGGPYISISAANVPVAEIIKTLSQETKINYFMFSEPKGNTTTIVSNLTYPEVISFLLRGTEHTYKIENGIYLIGERSLEGLRNTKVVQLQNRSAEIILDNIPADLKKGVDIKYFKELNSLILSGSQPRILEIEAFIKQVDKVVPVIHIEVIIVNVSKTRSTSTGISAGLDSNANNKSGGTLLPTYGFNFSSASINSLLTTLATNNIFNLGRVTPNFYVSLAANESQGNLNVQSTPKLSTLNGHEANLKIGSKIYYQLATQNVQGTLTSTVTRTVQYNSVEANLNIKIIPIVSGDEQVTLDIDVENTDFSANNPIPGGPPPTSTSAFKSIIRVRNEEMIVLGGLEKLSKTENGSGIPILSRIPIIKWLFSNRTKSRTKSKQLVFIRPSIIY
jgi:type IV pilus assembly protein PilQ